MKLLLGTLVFAGTLAFADEPVPVAKLPKPVSDALKAAFPNAAIVEASKSKTEFEVTVKDGGKRATVFVTPDGKVQQIEREIAEKELPAAIAAAARKKAPKATFHSARAGYDVQNGTETLDYFWVELTTAAKRSLELELEPDGTIIQVVRELTAKELPKPVLDAIRAKYPKAEIAEAEVGCDVKDGKEVPESYWVELHVGKKVVELDLLPDGTVEDETVRN